MIKYKSRIWISFSYDFFYLTEDCRVKIVQQQTACGGLAGCQPVWKSKGLEKKKEEEERVFKRTLYEG